MAIGSQDVVDYLKIHLDGDVNSEIAYNSLNKHVIKYHWDTYYNVLCFHFLINIGIPYTGFVLLQVFGTNYDNKFVKLSILCCVYSIVLQVINIFTIGIAVFFKSRIRLLLFTG